jgi:hypothetical protein
MKRPWLVTTLAGVPVACGVVACGLGVVGSADGTEGEGGDASSPSSSADSEVNPEDGGGGGGGGESDASAAADAPTPEDDEDADAKARLPRCDSGAFFCAEAGACVDRCKTSCGEAQVECVGCKSTGQGGVAIAICVTPDSGGCTSASISRCTCPMGRADCPGARQVCSASGQCLGCGEPGSDNLECKGGKRCDDDGTGNPLDNYTCR